MKKNITYLKNRFRRESAGFSSPACRQAGKAVKPDEGIATLFRGGMNGLQPKILPLQQKWVFEIGSKRPTSLNSGLGILEVVVAVAIIVSISLGVFFVAQLSLRSQRAATLDRRATLVADEGMAVARFVRDAGWSSFSALPSGTYLYPTFSGSTASLSQTNPGLVDGIFTSRVTLANVYRDGSGNIAGSGSPDADSRQAQVDVLWTDPFGKNRTITLTAYLNKI